MQKIPNGTKVKITDISKHSYGQIGIIYDYSMPPFYDVKSFGGNDNGEWWAGIYLPTQFEIVD